MDVFQLVGKSKAATKNEQRRFDLMKQGGCVACLQLGVSEDGEIHHLLAGYRRGHAFSICLCPFHHRGLCKEGLTYKQMKGYLGPSLAEEKKAFHEKFGTDDNLLEIQEEVIEKVEDSIV